jgi:hypothetical protein
VNLGQKGEREMATNMATLQAVILHYEKVLPRRENYKKKTVTHLEKLAKRLAHYVELLQELLARPGFGEDQTAKAMMEMYDYHRKAALLAIAAKTGEMNAEARA